MRLVRLAIANTYKKMHSKSNIPKRVYLEYVSITTTKHRSISNFNYAIFIFHINIKMV